MNIAAYHKTISETGFVEFPDSLSGDTMLVEKVIDYKSCDLELKTYLAEMILKRCFTPTHNCLDNDIDWFINGFQKDFQADLVEPWRTATIKKAIEMIMSDNIFTHGTIATTYMFGVIEFYAKCLLGWRSNGSDFFDVEYHKKFREMHIHTAIHKLKKIKSPLADSLNRIDRYNIELLKERGIDETRFVKARIGERLLLARNTMLHGEKHNFFDISHYLVMLYALFHLHHIQMK